MTSLLLMKRIAHAVPYNTPHTIDNFFLPLFRHPRRQSVNRVVSCHVSHARWQASRGEQETHYLSAREPMKVPKIMPDVKPPRKKMAIWFSVKPYDA